MDASLAAEVGSYRFALGQKERNKQQLCNVFVLSDDRGLEAVVARADFGH